MSGKYLTGHTDFVSSIAYSPDGEYIASGAWDKKVKVWSVSTGAEIRTLTDHTKYVMSVAYSPNRLLLSIMQASILASISPDLNPIEKFWLISRILSQELYIISNPCRGHWISFFNRFVMVIN